MTPQLIHDAFQYGDAEHEQYLREGYCFLDPFLTEKGLAWCRHHLDRMLSQLQPGRNPEEILSAHQQERWLIGEDNGAMAVLPRWHTKGKLQIRERGGSWFKYEIDPSELPANVDELKVNYYIKAGTLATHDTMIPHNSSPNLSQRWRRVIVLRYMDASGEMGDKTFANYRTGEQFPRRFFLVRGEDLADKGLPTSPFAREPEALACGPRK